MEPGTPDRVFFDQLEKAQSLHVLMAKEHGLYEFSRATKMKHQIVDGLNKRDTIWYMVLEAANPR